jgi:hypothetical protein
LLALKQKSLAILLYQGHAVVALVMVKLLNPVPDIMAVYLMGLLIQAAYPIVMPGFKQIDFIFLVSNTFINGT